MDDTLLGLYGTIIRINVNSLFGFYWRIIRIIVGSLLGFYGTIIGIMDGTLLGLYGTIHGVFILIFINFIVLLHFAFAHGLDWLFIKTILESLGDDVGLVAV